jgi:hypothetical protein
VIKPRAGGWFDAAEAEMEWQLGLFKDMAAKPLAAKNDAALRDTAAA